MRNPETLHHQCNTNNSVISSNESEDDSLFSIKQNQELSL